MLTKLGKITVERSGQVGLYIASIAFWQAAMKKTTITSKPNYSHNTWLDTGRAKMQSIWKSGIWFQIISKRSECVSWLTRARHTTREMGFPLHIHRKIHLWGGERMYLPCTQVPCQDWHSTDQTACTYSYRKFSKRGQAKDALGWPTWVTWFVTKIIDQSATLIWLTFIVSFMLDSDAFLATESCSKETIGKLMTL